MQGLAPTEPAGMALAPWFSSFPRGMSLAEPELCLPSLAVVPREGSLTWDPVDGSQRPQDPDGADRGQAHVVSIQGILHHAVGREQSSQDQGMLGPWEWGCLEF